MSYILDALNKSEKERARKQVPGLAALQGDEEPSSFSLKHFLVILLILIVVNLAGVYWMFGDRIQVTQEPAPAITPDAPVAGQETATIETRVEKLTQDQLQQSAATQPLQTLDTPPTNPTTVSVAATYDAVAIEDLPPEIQLRLPSIEVTTHIYASDAELRMVMINNIPRYEGDILTTDFRLLEISETGIVLEFEGYAYTQDVIEGWLE